MTLTIYGSINTRASRCLWAAEELGVVYDWKPLSTKDGSTRDPAYLAINPSGKLPALTDGDVVMSESLAMNLYMAQTYGTGSLWPAEPARQARVLQWTMWLATEMEPHILPLFKLLVLTPASERDPAAIDAKLTAVQPLFALLDTALAGHDYLLGDFTVADINLAAPLALFRNAMKVDLSAWPRLDAWIARCYDRAARRKIDAIPRG
ncbi:glutathione S-transferase family protein [Sphingomonas immobilis]|uniref:Glutathione S-transferase family protein n=1 Tax=Sphingomonas immobilis TaxID=3063997 RepID=A0ABT9A201_9SPHN|nr:glutathione S-transferase family protein [Sphingomonas sp. CA1-15]MDO7843394.1 glutathione S-transferase family protein [Sphingomonas sp. CA1-15]